MFKVDSQQRAQQLQPQSCGAGVMRTISETEASTLFAFLSVSLCRTTAPSRDSTWVVVACVQSPPRTTCIAGEATTKANSDSDTHSNFTTHIHGHQCLFLRPQANNGTNRPMQVAVCVHSLSAALGTAPETTTTDHLVMAPITTARDSQKWWCPMVNVWSHLPLAGTTHVSAPRAEKCGASAEATMANLALAHL